MLLPLQDPAFQWGGSVHWEGRERRRAILLTAAFALLLAGALGFQADATMGSGTQGLPMAAKDSSAESTDGTALCARQGVPPVEVLVRPLALTA